jgi:hypothetical protein
MGAGGTPLMWSQSIGRYLLGCLIVLPLLQHLKWLGNTWRQKLVVRLAKLASVD